MKWLCLSPALDRSSIQAVGFFLAGSSAMSCVLAAVAGSGKTTRLFFLVLAPDSACLVPSYSWREGNLRLGLQILGTGVFSPSLVAKSGGQSGVRCRRYGPAKRPQGISQQQVTFRAAEIYFWKRGRKVCNWAGLLQSDGVLAVPQRRGVCLLTPPAH